MAFGILEDIYAHGVYRTSLRQNERFCFIESQAFIHPDIPAVSLVSLLCGFKMKIGKKVIWHVIVK